MPARRPGPVAQPQLLDELDRAFSDRVAEGTTPAGAWAVVERGELVHDGAAALSGFAVPDAQRPFRIASCTKSFTAATTLLLRDRGLLDLDAPVSRYLAPLRTLRMPDGWPIPTVRMLLSMSAGLPTDDPWADRLESMTAHEFDDLLGRGIRFASVPGTTYEYSNLGYAMLGRVLSEVGERDFRELIRDQLLAPLGLERTGWDLHERMPVVAGYAPVPRADAELLRTAAGWVEQPFTSSGAFSSMGGLFSTLADLGRWTDVLGSALAEEGAVDAPLSAASRRELQQIHRVMPGPPEHRVPIGPTMGYGFGVITDHGGPHGDTVAHSGGYPGYTTHMRWSAARRIGVVAFEAAPYTGIVRVSAPWFERLLDALEVRPPAPAPWPELAAAGRTVEAALRDAGRWSRVVDLCAPNIELDEPMSSRQRAASAALAEVGAFTGPGDLRPAGTAEGDWVVPAERGSVTIELLLTPTDPPLLQRFAVVAEPERADA